jgi:hypothetical protein
MIYSQSTGKLFDSSGNLIGIGYAGNGNGKNNPAMQDVKCIGPLPRGRYTISNPHNSDHTGPFTLDLIPDAGNEMFGRDEFKMHGDSITEPGTASNGCIVMSRYIRDLVWNSKDHRLIVIV